jgi:CHAT domain-containing protein
LPGGGPEGTWTAKDDELPAKVRQLLQNPHSKTDWKAWLGDLAKQRLEPLAKYLGGIKHLIVLPSGMMAGIPLEALTERYQISYAPSATIYSWLQKHRKYSANGSGNLLALAAPVFSQQIAAFRNNNDEFTRVLRGELSPLPGTRGEVESISRLFGAGDNTLLLGSDASGANVERLASDKKLRQYRYIHLATHGFADPKGGLNSYLALTPVDSAVSTHDKLSASQILRTWHLDADLVTLSACTTALGQYQGGEGYVGFSQALFLTGAHTVVLSQWRVHDLSTTLLMERFYQNLLGKRDGLKAPLPKVEALAEARRWVKELTRQQALERLKTLGLAVQEKALVSERPFEHPYYWAPFILIGDPGTGQ